MAINENQIEHLVAGMHVDLARLNLTRKGTVGTEKKLLPGLTSCVEGTRDLSTTKRTVCKVATVLTREGDALRNTLVDDGAVVQAGRRWLHASGSHPLLRYRKRVDIRCRRRVGSFWLR